MQRYCLPAGSSVFWASPGIWIWIALWPVPRKKEVDAALRADVRIFGLYNGDAGVHEQNIAPTIMLKRFVPNDAVAIGLDDNRNVAHHPSIARSRL